METATTKRRSFTEIAIVLKEVFFDNRKDKRFEYWAKGFILFYKWKKNKTRTVFMQTLYKDYQAMNRVFNNQPSFDIEQFKRAFEAYLEKQGYSFQRLNIRIFDATGDIPKDTSDIKYTITKIK